MFQRPILKPHYRLTAVPGEGILLLSEKGNDTLYGPLYALVTPCLDGERSPDDVVAKLQGQASAEDVHSTLKQLEERGFLTEGRLSLPHAEASWWSLQGIDPRFAAQRLARISVAVTALDIKMDPFLAALQSMRVKVGAPAQLDVVLTNDYLHPRLKDFNDTYLLGERPWLLVRPVGSEIWLGPLFEPEQTGCWECLAQRLRHNRLEILAQGIHAEVRLQNLAVSHTPASLQVAWNLAATKVAEWVVHGKLEDLQGRVLSLDVRSGQSQMHTLVWRPECPACGMPSVNPDRPAQRVTLLSRRKTFTQDGGHRTLSPQATLDRHGHHVSSITGAVSQLQVAQNGVIHAYQANHNFGLPTGGLKNWRGGLRGKCGGKGASDLQARASGLCEALERYSGVFRGDEPRRSARLQELGAAAIHPNVCMRFSDRQFRERDLWNARGSKFNFVPRPFAEDDVIDWSPVWSLTQQEGRWLPTAYCYFAYPIAREESFVMACSNGSAAGNTLEEAVLQGFLELAERDSVALWWYNRVRRPIVDLDSFGEPYLAELRDYLRSKNRELWVLDITNDLGVPAFAAISRRPDRQPEHLMVGFGAHLDARVGVMRAVTELNQMLVGLLRRPDEDMPDSDDGKDTETANWLKNATLCNQPYLVPHPDLPPRRKSDFPDLCSDDLRDDVLTCQRIVERQGLEMLVLDQTRADIGLPVVKVIVPGLRHFWARFAPGRLYDVPVKLGWLPQPLAEHDLNPVPVFL